MIITIDTKEASASHLLEMASYLVTIANNKDKKPTLTVVK